MRSLRSVKPILLFLDKFLGRLFSFNNRRLVSMKLASFIEHETIRVVGLDMLLNSNYKVYILYNKFFFFFLTN